MHETIDLIAHAAMRDLRAFTRRTKQPTTLELMDTAPIEHVNEIEITEEHITLKYNEKTTHRYNANEITHREWSYKYNDDPEFVRAIGAVIELARKHARDMPENVACPPGCAECCSGYEPFVSKADVQRIADHFGMPYAAALDEYVVKRDSADGYIVGYLRKVEEDIASQCVFLKGNGSGRYYCGIYDARPHDCGAFTPIGCDDVDAKLRHDRKFEPGSPFKPKVRALGKTQRPRVTYDAIVVGGGHNGLVAAAYLAKAGRSVLVLERRDVLGGTAVSEAVWPGWTVSTASYVCSLLHPQVVADLRLKSYGYEAYAKDPSSFTPLPDGRSLLLGNDAVANAREIATFERADVAGFAAFERAATGLGRTLFDAFERDDPENVHFDDATHATLYGSAAAFVERYVATPVLQATLATDGLIGTYAGPRDAGTAYVLAYHYAGRALEAQGAWGFVRGGMGAISRAIALSARIAGATFVTSATVARILVRDGRACGVALADGTEYLADVVLSNADPIATFAEMLAPSDLPASLARRVADWRIEGCSLKLNLALGELPNFTARPGNASAQAHHRATIHVAPTIDYLQSAHDDARTHGASPAPMLECFMQTPTDPSLAPPGKHLLSVFAQYFPYHRADGAWDAAKRAAARDTIVATLARYAPNLPNAIEGEQLLAAPDLEERFGLHGGHIFHGELLPGQILGERFATRTPLAGLYLCGSGASPGGCVSGIPGLRAARAVAVDTFAPLPT